MSWRKIGLAGALALIAASALGAESKYSPTYEACIAKSGSVDFEMGSCAYEEADRQDTTLNATYKQLMGIIDADRKASLIKAQRAWIAFRDAECGFNSSEAAGGTLERVLDANCRVGLTAQRAKDLKAYLDTERRLNR